MGTRWEEGSTICLKLKQKKDYTPGTQASQSRIQDLYGSKTKNEAMAQENYFVIFQPTTTATTNRLKESRRNHQS